MKDKYTLNLLNDNDNGVNDISFWINDIQNNHKFSKVLKSKAFKRLKDISFLGAIDYSEDNKLSRKNRSRETHSLYVAALANYVATMRSYDEDLKDNLIAAALIHDIGHMPLSHSAEPYAKSIFGYGHHEIGEQLIDGEGKLGAELKNILTQYFDVHFIKSLLNNKVTRDGGDLFCNQINIDTIDGIIRSLEYKGKNSTNRLNRIEIAKHAFLETDCRVNKFNCLDRFWKAKHFVYYNFINREHAFISDKMSQAFFMENNKVCESDFYSTENVWSKKHSVLFSWLKGLKHNALPECMIERDFELISRTYYIVDDQINLNDRYKNTKNIKKANVSKFITNDHTQLALKIQDN